MQYNRLNELVQQNNIRESTYKINLDNAKKCAYSRVMVTYKGADNMNLATFKKDLKNCGKVFGYVKYSRDDGTMMELKKADILFVFENYPADTEISYSVDYLNRMYING
jgi:hypothetical protein